MIAEYTCCACAGVQCAIVFKHCTVKHHTDIINFACMTWNFVRIPASLSALCTNFERRKEKFNPRSPVSAPGDQSFRQIWFSFYAEKKLFVCRKNI